MLQQTIMIYSVRYKSKARKLFTKKKRNKRKANDCKNHLKYEQVYYLVIDGTADAFC